jgi:hypothetical protein
MAKMTLLTHLCDVLQNYDNLINDTSRLGNVMIKKLIIKMIIFVV